MFTWERRHFSGASWWSRFVFPARVCPVRTTAWRALQPLRPSQARTPHGTVPPAPQVPHILTDWKQLWFCWMQGWFLSVPASNGGGCFCISSRSCFALCSGFGDAVKRRSPSQPRTEGVGAWPRRVLVLLLAACLRISPFAFKLFFAIQIRSKEGEYWFVAGAGAAAGAAALCHVGVCLVRREGM